MKRIFGLMAILLIWAGLAEAGVLKVMVPADEFKQMESRLEKLEKENNQLQQEVRSMQAKPSDKEKGPQINALVQENKQLKQEVESMAEKFSEKTVSSKEMDNKLSTLGRENRKLKRKVSSLKEKGLELSSDRRTANQVYSEANKKLASHIFK